MEGNKKILLINPYYRDRIVYFRPSLGLLYLAAILRKEGIETKILDYFGSRGDTEEIKNCLEEYPFVGITVSIGTITKTIEISEKIRKFSPDTKIIMGGPHPTAIFNKLIPLYADIVVLGEGEDTIIEFLKGVDLSQIKGIAYWENGLKVNQPRPLLLDLDKLPYPAWDLIKLAKYKSPDTPKIVAHMITSRGCPYECIYCTKFIHGLKIRLRSIDNILGEIDYLYTKFNVRQIEIWDSNFTFYPERVHRLCQKIINQNYKGLSFFLSSGIRADICDEEMFELLAKAGFNSVSIGVESGSQEVLDKIKKQLDLKKVHKTICTARKVGMQVYLFFMIGLPFDTLETIQETINFAKSLALSADHILFWLALPFPGTEFYELVEKQGRFLCDLTLNSHIYTKNEPVYEMPNLKAADVKKMLKRAYRQVYLRPNQIWRQFRQRIKYTPRIWQSIITGWKTLFYGDWRV